MYGMAALFGRNNNQGSKKELISLNLNIVLHRVGIRLTLLQLGAMPAGFMKKNTPSILTTAA